MESQTGRGDVGRRYLEEGGSEVKLWRYQEEGVRFLAQRVRAYLADEMGLGKTVQAIIAASLVKPDSILVVCPASACPNWEREFQRWWPADVESPDITVVSYAWWSRHSRRYLSTTFDLVILDEAHYIKSPSARRTKAALRFATAAKRCWMLSGTPMPNHPGELWTVFKNLFPGVPRRLKITTHFHWIDYFTKWVATDYGPRPYAVRNEDKLQPFLRRIMLRRKLRDVALDLPPLRVDVQLLPVNDSKLDEKMRELIEAETGQPEDQVYLATLRRYVGRHKAPLIAEIVRDEVKGKQYEKIVVLYYHKEVRDAFRHLFDLHGVRYVGFGGDTPAAQRAEAIDDFTNGEIPVFLAQQTAAGIAINLQCASEIILVEPAWSPEDNAQAIKRIHRIGQDQPCRARIFAVEHTLDEQIMGVLAQKTRMITQTLGG